jgi:hypothetical protein
MDILPEREAHVPLEQRAQVMMLTADMAAAITSSGSSAARLRAKCSIGSIGISVLSASGRGTRCHSEKRSGRARRDVFLQVAAGKSCRRPRYASNQSCRHQKRPGRHDANHRERCLRLTESEIRPAQRTGAPCSARHSRRHGRCSTGSIGTWNRCRRLPTGDVRGTLPNPTGTACGFFHVVPAD